VVIATTMGLLKKKDSTSARSSTSPCADLRNAYHNCFNKWVSFVSPFDGFS